MAWQMSTLSPILITGRSSLRILSLSNLDNCQPRPDSSWHRVKTRKLPGKWWRTNLSLCGPRAEEREESFLSQRVYSRDLSNMCPGSLLLYAVAPEGSHTKPLYQQFSAFQMLGPFNTTPQVVASPNRTTFHCYSITGISLLL